jgi:hypothetical protein
MNLFKHNLPSLGRHPFSLASCGPASEAQHYREEAARVRLDAARFIDERHRQHLLDIAAQYDRLAADLKSGLLR